VQFVVCHNPEAAERDQQVRANVMVHLAGPIDGSDAWSAAKRSAFAGTLKHKPGLRPYLHRTPKGLLRIDRAAAKREAHHLSRFEP